MRTQGNLLSKSRKIKAFAEILLLLSFLAQTLLFDYFNDKSNSLDKAYVGQSLIDKGAEVKELKYFVANFPSDSNRSREYQKVNIHMAARKVASSQIMVVIASEKDKQDKIDLGNKLLQKANGVYDFDS
jgi:hypothetical protein